MKKFFGILLMSAVLACCSIGFVSCDDNNPDDGNNPNPPITGTPKPDNPDNPDNPATPSGTTEYTFEAEYTDLEDLSGASSSGSAEGVDMIQSAAKASNGYYIGFTYKEGLTITFEIVSDSATTAELKVGLAPWEGMSAISISSETFVVGVNGKSVKYTSTKVSAGRGENDMGSRSFNKYKIGKVDLVKGENVITLTIGPNDYVNGGAGGPAIDAVYLTTAATLTWDPITDNID